MPNPVYPVIPVSAVEGFSLLSLDKGNVFLRVLCAFAVNRICS